MARIKPLSIEDIKRLIIQIDRAIELTKPEMANLMPHISKYIKNNWSFKHYLKTKYSL